MKKILLLWLLAFQIYAQESPTFVRTSYIPLSGTSSLAGSIIPATNNSYDLGSGGSFFRSAYLGNTIYTPSVRALNTLGLSLQNNAGTSYFRLFDSGNIGLQGGGTYIDDGVNRLQIVGNLSVNSGSGTNTITLRDATISKAAGSGFSISTGVQVAANSCFGSPTIVGTHTITLPSVSTGIAHYNTVDQATNLERVRQYWSGNQYYISSESGGTGISRNVFIGVGTTRGINVGNATSGGSVVNINDFNLSIANSSLLSLTGTSPATSGITNVESIFTTINQSGTAGYRALWISPYEQATGSGVKYLIDAGTNSASNGGGTHTSKFFVDNQGNSVQTGKATFDATFTTAGTTGNQTINKPAGSVNIAAGQSSITVTNSFATTTSLIIPVVYSNDATAQIKNVVRAPGSFTINLVSPATSETPIGFVIH